MTWLLLPPHQSLAFLLADNGFDVWIANTRGTKYSRGHVSLTPADGVNFCLFVVDVLKSLFTFDTFFIFYSCSKVVYLVGCLALLELVMG